MKELRLAGPGHDRGRESVPGGVAADLQSALHGPPVQAADLHRPKPAGGDLTRLPCIKTTRCLRRDWTVVHHGQLYQVRSTVRATHVIVEDRVDGTMRMTHKGRGPLTYQAIVARPLRVASPPKIARPQCTVTPTRAHP